MTDKRVIDRDTGEAPVILGKGDGFTIIDEDDQHVYVRRTRAEPRPRRRRTVAGLWGTDAVHALAEIAVDLLCDPPAEGFDANSTTAQVDWELVEEGRAIMERHGIHWRALKADNERYWT